MSPSPIGPAHLYRVPPGACDCHFHVFGPADKYPPRPGLKHLQPDASLADHLAMQARLGLDRMVFVQPSTHGADNRLMLAAMAEAGPRCRGIAVFDTDIPDAELDRFHAAGVRGMRVNVGSNDPAVLPEVWAQVTTLAARFEPRGWHLQFLIHGHLRDALLPRLADLPIDVVIDHMSLFRPDRINGHPGFQALLDLLGQGNCWVKLSGADRVTRGGDYDAALPVMTALIDAAPDRMVWGSDWPHTGTRPPLNEDDDPIVVPFGDVDEARLIAVLADACPDVETFNKILAENPARLYDFI